MKFALSAEQREFGAVVHNLLASADVPAAARAWAAGDHAPGLAIWRSLGKAGVTALAVPEHSGGLGAHPVDLVVACEQLGYHPLPGPVAESLAAVPQLLAGLPDSEQTGEWLAGLASGELLATMAMPPRLPYALDADAADLVLLASGPGASTASLPTEDTSSGSQLAGSAYSGQQSAGGADSGQQPTGSADSGQQSTGGAGSGAVTIWRAVPRARLESADQARRLFEVWPAQALLTGQPAGQGAEQAAATAIARAISYGTLASAAQLLGAGRGLLDASTGHAKTREQFGRPIGAFQAVKHALADVLIGLEFARPLLYAAAVALGDDAPTTARDISSARVACADAARRAARTALQVHGAIGYTQECDISLWLAKVRALAATWGSQAEHRAVVLAALTQERTGAWS